MYRGVCRGACRGACSVGNDAAIGGGGGGDGLTVWCPGGPTLPMDPSRGVFSPATQWAQPVGGSETVETLSRMEIAPFGRSMAVDGLLPKDGSRCPIGNRGGCKNGTQRCSLSTHENWCSH